MSDVLTIIPVFNVIRYGLINIVKKLVFKITKIGWDVLIVDDASVDDTFIHLRKYPTYYLRLRKNLGFAGAVNAAFSYIKNLKDYKYLVISNSDVIIISTNNLLKLIEFLDGNPKLGGVQGLILDPSGRVYSYGGAITERGYPIGICSGIRAFSPAFNYKCSLNKEYLYVTYVDGAFSIFRFDTLKNLEVPFPSHMTYSDDWLLGILLWNKNRPTAAINIPTVVHLVSTTYGRQYFGIRPTRARFAGFARGFSLNFGGISYYLRDLIRSKFNNEFITYSLYGTNFFTKKFNIKLCDIVLAKDSFHSLFGKIYATDLYFKKCHFR